MSAVQLDLFGEVEADEATWAAGERDRLQGALICLRDSCPHTLEVVRHLTWWKPRNETGPSYTPPWAYLVNKGGVNYEHETTWGGFDCRPANCVTWSELVDLLGSDPRRVEVIDWADGLWQPSASDPWPWVDDVPWRYLCRPYEMYPSPDEWHPSYIEGDRAKAGHGARMKAWRTTLAILNDALEASA
jgi:hypothetical protein